MRYVLDASVAVAAVRPNEPSHAAARTRLTRLLTGVDEIAVPTIFAIEVAAALARVGWPLADIEQYVAALAVRTLDSVSITAARSRRIRGIAIRTRLRAADAVYVWLASSRQITLVTLDHEVIMRGAPLCTIVPP
jgi:predicted nucleic acid-binding protein